LPPPGHRRAQPYEVWTAAEGGWPEEGGAEATGRGAKGGKAAAPAMAEVARVSAQGAATNEFVG
jgi:hypothetical protein